MEIAIVSIGLLLTIAGTYMAWHNKGAGVWATLAFGFLLVLVGGPVSSRLGSFSLTGTGIEVDFDAVVVSIAEEGALTERVKATLLALTTPVDDDASTNKMQLGSASRSFQRDLINYITSTGFVPVQPIGAELLRPGTVARLEEGRPIVWASSPEAFRISRLPNHQSPSLGLTKRP